MVQLEEVKDAELNAPQPGPVSDDYDDDADFTDTGIPLLPSLAHILHLAHLPSHISIIRLRIGLSARLM